MSITVSIGGLATGMQLWAARFTCTRGHSHSIRTNSNRRNNMLNDATPRPREFGAEMTRWMDLACVHSMLQALRTRYDSSCHTNSPYHHPFTHPDHFLDDPAASYYPHSPMASLGAPIPSTLHSHAGALSSSPLISGMGRTNGRKPILPLYLPHPCAYCTRTHSDICHEQCYGGSYNKTAADGS